MTRRYRDRHTRTRVERVLHTRWYKCTQPTHKKYGRESHVSHTMCLIKQKLEQPLAATCHVSHVSPPIPSSPTHTSHSSGSVRALTKLWKKRKSNTSGCAGFPTMAHGLDHSPPRKPPVPFRQAAPKESSTVKFSLPTIPTTRRECLSTRTSCGTTKDPVATPSKSTEPIWMETQQLLPQTIYQASLEEASDASAVSDLTPSDLMKFLFPKTQSEKTISLLSELEYHNNETTRILNELFNTHKK